MTCECRWNTLSASQARETARGTAAALLERGSGRIAAGKGESRLWCDASPRANIGPQDPGAPAPKASPSPVPSAARPVDNQRGAAPQRNELPGRSHSVRDKSKAGPGAIYRFSSRDQRLVLATRRKHFHSMFRQRRSAQPQASKDRWTYTPMKSCT